MDTFVESTLAILSQAHPGAEIAFLFFGDTALYATYSGPREAPTSAVVKLIQGIYETRPEMARQIVRARIYTTMRPTEMCLGMVRVAAKRITGELCAGAEPRSPAKLICVAPHGNFPSIPVPACPATPGDHGPEAFLALAGDLSLRAHREDTLYLSDRPVAALLVSERGEILGAAANCNARNRTLHAEVNLVQNFYQRTGKRLPAGSTIYTTLKPCKMCAAMIWHSAEDLRTLRVIYAEDDPGPNGRATVLDLGTHERKRAAKTAEELALIIQKKLQL